MDEQYETFEAVESRLQAIVDEVSSEDISLDDALSLYEEAAKLTNVACTLSEQGIKEMYPSEEEDSSSDEEGADVAVAAPDAEALPGEAAPTSDHATEVPSGAEA